MQFCLSFGISSETGTPCWDRNLYNQKIGIANEEFLEVNIGQFCKEACHLLKFKWCQKARSLEPVEVKRPFL